MLTKLTPVARLSDMQCKVWMTASCRLNQLAILLISCTPLFSQRKVLSEIGQVCGEKRHSSSYETDQGKQPRKVFIDRCQNSRPTCWPVEEQASGAIGSDDVSANPQSMHKIIDIGNFVGRSLSERDRITLLLNSWTPYLHTTFVLYTHRLPEATFPNAMVGGV